MQALQIHPASEHSTALSFADCHTNMTLAHADGMHSLHRTSLSGRRCCCLAQLLHGLSVWHALCRSKVAFDMAGAWQGRCRKWYADRYDFRDNIVSRSCCQQHAAVWSKPMAAVTLPRLAATEDYCVCHEYAPANPPCKARLHHAPRAAALPCPAASSNVYYTLLSKGCIILHCYVLLGGLGLPHAPESAGHTLPGPSAGQHHPPIPLQVSLSCL
jgi:hypothetical protein